MGNQVRNGRNYKDNIIKLSLNSFSTNSAIHDNLSSFNDKKIKNIKNFGKFEEKYFSKIIPTEKINIYNKKSQLNNNTNNYTNKENYQTNSRNDLFSQKNKIIFISTYSSNANKLNNNKFNNKSSKNEIKNKGANINKTIFTEYNNTNIINKNINKFQNQNSNKEFLYSIFNNKNIQNEKKKILNLNLNEIDSLNYIENENQSSINSSKFINFDIVNENISNIDGLELTESSKKNINYEITKKNYDKNQNNNKPKKECCYEKEFEEYIKKLNLGDVNIDRELFERPLFYNRSKKINSNKNYFRTNDSKISPDSLEKKIPMILAIIKREKIIL